jgi:PAS domain S-box-containing protein
VVEQVTPQYRQLADALPLMLWIASVDGAVTYVNRYTLEYTGRPESASSGEAWLSLIHPEDRARTWSLWREALARNRRGSHVTRIQRKDGTYDWGLCQYHPIASADGRVELWIGAVIELEDEVKLRAATRLSEIGYRSIVEQATEGIWTIDQDGITDYINQRGAEILGYSVDEIIGRHASDFVPPEDREQAKRRIEARKTAEWDHHDELQLRLQKKDGSEVWVHFSARPILNPSGAYQGALAMFSDINERKRAEVKLLESSIELESLSRRLLELQEAERRSLARELHDELGQILTAVNINLHATRNLAGGAAQSSLDESAAIVDRAIQQVRSMSLELRPSMLDDLGLDAALRWYIDRQAQRTGLWIHLSLHLPERLPTELETACFRIVQEAISNTVRHARAKRMWVTIDRHGEAVEVVVQDDGVGFDVEAKRRRAGGGASVGLVAMEERVRLVGGQLHVESAPTKGAEIRIRIPFAPQEETHG